MFQYWMTGEHPDEKENKRKTNTLIATTYLLTREALVSDRKGKREEARALRAAAHEIEKLIGRMEAAVLRQEQNSSKTRQHGERA
jgi:hypothetical protein